MQMYKEIKYNRNILDFKRFVENLTEDIYEDYSEYIITDSTSLVFRTNRSDCSIRLFYCNLVLYNLTFGLDYKEIATIIDENFNTYRYKIKIMVVSGYAYEEFNTTN